MIRRVATSLLLIVTVALGIRAVFAWNQVRKIPPQLRGTVPFQTETGHIAYSLAAGKGYASPFQRDSGSTAWLAPVYPLIVAGIFKVFGVYTSASFYVAIFLNIIFSSATCITLFYTGKRIAGMGLAALAAWLWAFFPNAILIPFEWIWDTSLAALLAALLLWATLRLTESRRWRNWCGYGLLWGLTLMTNPALLSLCPVLMGWLLYRTSRSGPSASLKPLIAALLTLLCCLPWTVRNFVVFHRFIPFRSNLSYELYIGNNENYDERHRVSPTAVTQELETLRYLRLGEIAFMDEERRKALHFIATHPRIELKLLAWRFVDFWIGVPDPWRAFCSTDSWLIRGILLGNFLSSLGVLTGTIALFAKRNPYAVPVVAYPLAFPLLYYATHTSLRYRHPIDPVVLLLTSIAIGLLWHWLAAVMRLVPQASDARL